MKWYEKAKRLMKQKGIKQKDLIEPLGVKTRGCVGHYLTGRRDPDAWQLKVIADMLDCTMDALMGDDETDPVKRQIARTIRTAELAMETEAIDFSDDEKLSIYRSAFMAGLDPRITDEQLTSYLKSVVKK
jgi:transcriptional regulator with XRE-family HTH domain